MGTHKTTAPGDKRSRHKSSDLQQAHPLLDVRLDDILCDNVFHKGRLDSTGRAVTGSLLQTAVKRPEPGRRDPAQGRRRSRTAGRRWCVYRSTMQSCNKTCEIRDGIAAAHQSLASPFCQTLVGWLWLAKANLQKLRPCLNVWQQILPAYL